jgi:hypothetical protein
MRSTDKAAGQEGEELSLVKSRSGQTGLLNRDMKLYLLTHEYEDEFSEKIKFIGIFSSVELAESAINRLRVQPGFREHPEGFEISEQSLDLVGWQEGFDKW